MIKACIFALLVISVFTAKLTPGTKLPSSFDNLIHNNLGSVESFGEESTSVHKVSKEIGKTSSAEMLAFLTTELPWANIRSLSTIIQSALKVEDSRIESHYIFQSFVQLSEFRYAMINLINFEEKFKVVVSYEFRPAFGIHQDTIYHDVRSSFYGFPFDSHTILTNENGDKPEFHEFNKNKLMADLKTIRGTPRSDLLGLDPVSVMATAGVVVKGLTDCWKNIVDAFKTIDSSTIKQTINGQGFSKFQKSSRSLRMLLVPLKNFAEAKKTAMLLLGMTKNSKFKSEIEAIVNSAKWGTALDWDASEFTFDTDTVGKCNSAVTLSKAHITEQQFSIIGVVIDATFQLAPNIIIYENFKSIAGGIVQTTRQERKSVPRDLTEKDMKAINNMIKVSGLQFLAKETNVKWTLPDSAFPK